MLHLEAALQRFSRLAKVRANRFFPSSDCTFAGARVAWHKVPLWQSRFGQSQGAHNAIDSQSSFWRAMRGCVQVL